MIPQSVQISNTEIYIEAQFFIHKDYSFTGKELLLDIFAEYYTTQQIRIYIHDGENLGFSGFLTFIEDLARIFDIPNDSITIESHGPTGIFKRKNLALGIFLSAGRYIPEIKKDLSNAKFVGTTLGRFNPTRFRLAYEIDTVFPKDNFTVFQPRQVDIDRNYQHVAEVYAKELAWFRTKTFDQGMQSSHQSGMIDWQPGCEQYPTIWNKFQIEIVSETDALSDFWFTEKTARCLATGKPFVLVAGTGAISKLRSLGFQTFDPVIDESYDLATTPTERIHQIISSLKPLHNNSAAITELYRIAKHNIEIYQHYSSTTRE